MCGFILFQATISLVITYEPPASAIPNPNAQVDGDASAGETGQFIADFPNTFCHNFVCGILKGLIRTFN